MRARLVMITTMATLVLPGSGGLQAQAPVTSGAPTAAAAAPRPRPTPPTRDPNTPGYVKAAELPDGTLPGPDQHGNFIIGPTHAPAPETLPQDGVPRGTVHEFTLTSAESTVRLRPRAVRRRHVWGR